MVLSIFGIPLQNILFYMLPLLALKSAFTLYKRLDTDKIFLKLFPFAYVGVVVTSCLQIYQKGLMDQEGVHIMTQMVIFTSLLTMPMNLKK